MVEDGSKLSGSREVWDDLRRDIALARAPEARGEVLVVEWLSYRGGAEVRIDGEARWRRAAPLSFDAFAGVV